jgi:hypothetical protein
LVHFSLVDNSTNPRTLRTEIYDRIDDIFSLPTAADGASQNVHLTLASRSEANNEEDTSLLFAFNRTEILPVNAHTDERSGLLR